MVKSLGLLCLQGLFCIGHQPHGLLLNNTATMSNLTLPAGYRLMSLPDANAVLPDACAMCREALHMDACTHCALSDQSEHAISPAAASFGQKAGLPIMLLPAVKQ